MCILSRVLAVVLPAAETPGRPSADVLYVLLVTPCGNRARCPRLPTRANISPDTRTRLLRTQPVDQGFRVECSMIQYTSLLLGEGTFNGRFCLRGGVVLGSFHLWISE